MDFALAGGKGWSRMLVDGYARTMLAGATAPTAARGGAVLVLSTACRRYGAPKPLLSESGGAYIAAAFRAGCRRWGLEQQPIKSTQGPRYVHWMEPHCKVQRRLYDAPFSLTTTPLECAQAPQAFRHLDHTTAHQGLLQEPFAPLLPLPVLGQANGRFSTPEELARKFSRALLPRTTHPYGWGTLHRDHVDVNQGVPHTQVLLWVYGAQLRAVWDNGVLAEYHCRDDWRPHKVTERRAGVFSPTRFASPQGLLLPLNPQEALVL
jgi:hypothetical protein